MKHGGGQPLLFLYPPTSLPASHSGIILLDPGKPMTPDDKEALKELRNGVVLGIGVLAVFSLFIALFSTLGQPDNPETKFEVVDRYKNCDVVRYTPWKVAEYKYLLHCEP